MRNAGLLLLVDLTGGANEDLKKIVAFEDVFVKIFALIETEGGLADAGITAQDCLTLLANLIDGSASNQTMFRESGCATQLVRLLGQVFPQNAREEMQASASREKPAFGLLKLLHFFVIPGEAGTGSNQAVFFRAGLVQLLIDVGFAAALSTSVRTLSLTRAAEFVADNPPLQEAFAALTVSDPTLVNGIERETQQSTGSRSKSPTKRSSVRRSAENPRTYIIEALLDLTLDRPHDDVRLRAAACGAIQAYLGQHDRIKSHFLQRAISGHAQHEKASNVLTTLSEPKDDPSALLFASWILEDIVMDDFNAKEVLTAVKEGDANAGEDVLSFLQTVGAHLEEALLKDTEVASVSAYCTLLSVVLWDFAIGVDDLLAESASLLQVLTQMSQNAALSPLTDGLCATLLGIIYEFSTKDSPTPRRTIAPLLTQKLTRSRYLQVIAELRRHPAIRDSDVDGSSEEELLFCKSFVDLFMDEYSRLRKAIDKDPGIEVLPSSSTDAGVDRDVLDDLRQQLQTARDTSSQTQQERAAIVQQHDQERLTAAKDLQTAKASIERLQRINQSMQQGHETELTSLSTRHEQQMQDLNKEHRQVVEAARTESQLQIQNAVRSTEDSFREQIQDRERRLTELGNTHRAEQGAHTSTREQLEALTGRHNDLILKEKNASEQLADLIQRHDRQSREYEQLQTSSMNATHELDSIRKSLEQSRSEAEQFSTQLKELQEELKAKEEELATERAGFADLEKKLEGAKSADASRFGQNVNDEHGGKIASIESELKRTQESEKSAKEELDSMLLVIGDIEAKRDQYKAKLKELGGEVSEEDDDEDEEEDEEEDGEDVE